MISSFLALSPKPTHLTSTLFCPICYDITSQPFDWDISLQEFLTASSFGLMAAVISLIALVAVCLAAEFTRKRAGFFGALAASLIIMIAAFHILPESLSAHPMAWMFAVLGFVGGFALQSGLKRAAGGPRRSERMIALAPVIAIAVHSTLDGWTYAVTFSVDTMTGVTAATGLVIHEFPEAIICFLLLQRAGLTNAQALFWAFMASGVTTAASAVIGAPFTAGLSMVTLSILFALSAGLLLQVGISHLVRQASQTGWIKTSPLVITGFLLASAFTLVQAEVSHAGVAHGHLHAHDDDSDAAP